jgi:hypothetical protein
MAEIQRLVATSQLKTDFLTRLARGEAHQVFVNYDGDFDALMILIVPPDTETIVHYLDNHVGLLYQPDTLEIVGLQVESFERSFVPAHASVQKVWKLSKTVGKEVDSIGDLMLMVERLKPQIAREVVRASKDVPEELATLM